MESPGSIETARSAFARQAWTEARLGYAAADAEATLTLDDIECYAIALHLTGDEAACRNALARGYREAQRHDDVTRAVRFSFWLAHSMFFSGETGQASGWNARARSLLSDRGVADCAEWGYLLILPGVDRLMTGDTTSALATFNDALAIARRFADADLEAAAGHGRGRTLLKMGYIAEGMTQLDEVMVAVAAREVSPMLIGPVYCGVLEACQEAYDLLRAREWTAALSRWCEGQADLVPYRGPCLVHRVEMMRLGGEWDDALEEARRACEWLSMPASPEGPADAFYQLAELYRLRGDFFRAEEAYRQASRLGRAPEPGLSLLWLAQGHAEAAASAVKRALGETPAEERSKRADLLNAQVEIQLALANTAAARAAADQLLVLCRQADALPLQALSERALGGVLIATGDPRAALSLLRHSWSAWKQLQAPYEAARTRCLIALACRELGDVDSAVMEEDAAGLVFEQLGAAPDLRKLVAPAMVVSPPARASGLTPREVEVLQFIAAGETNKAIAAGLVISEHTVARHVQNILQKLDLSSRAAVAAFAVEHGLAHPTTGQN